MCSLEDKNLVAKWPYLCYILLVLCDRSLYMEDLRLLSIVWGVNVLAAMGLSLFKPRPQIQPTGPKLRPNGPACLQNVQINE